MTILVTGGAGFIGSNFVRDWLSGPGEAVLNLDLLKYAGNLRNLDEVRNDERHVFVKGDISDRSLVDVLLRDHAVSAIVHFAAETHVDRSIQDPGVFVRTNILGTYSLLEAARHYCVSLDESSRARFRFLYVSTDEVYGPLKDADRPFDESCAYRPTSPYSATKASASHLVCAWFKTFGLPVLIANCSNSYGPFQFPEKLIPKVIVNALAEKPLPVYGDGRQIRDWLHVSDHCRALRAVLKRGNPGETYNIGGWNEQANIDVVRAICILLDEFRAPHIHHERLITRVTDRPGHDRRYALNTSRIERDLDWRPKYSFQAGLRATVRWYLDHPEWIASTQSS